MSKIKLGIIGCGGIANGKHLPSYAKLADEVEVVAFCDLEIVRAEKAAKEYGTKNAKVFNDYKQLLSLELDAVCVCTPNVSHCKITVDALKSGKHVMCEKPMAASYAEAQQMVEAAEKSGKLLTIGYQNRYRPDTLYLKNVCEAGELGDIYYAKAHAVRRRAVPTWGVFLDGEKQGGGPLIDIGTHALDLALFMMDNYEPEYAVGSTYHKLNNQTNTANAWGDWDCKKFTVEDSAFGFIVMKNGATISLESSWALNTLDVREAAVSLCGTKGGADMPHSNSLRINGVKHGRQFTETPDFSSGGVAFFDGTEVFDRDVEARTFVDAITGKGKVYVTPRQAAVVTRILEGIYISASTKKPCFFN